MSRKSKKRLMLLLSALLLALDAFDLARAMCDEEDE